MNFISRVIRRDVFLEKVKSIVTRFPPEPNGHLHIGHLKSLCLNYSIAKEHGGTCKLRFDDTNPRGEKENYVSSVLAILTWLGYRTVAAGFASNYYHYFYRYAKMMIGRKLLYVDGQDYRMYKVGKGSFGVTGEGSVARDQRVGDNIRLLRQMRFGRFKSRVKVLRAKINMASVNVNLRDPVFFRVSYDRHYRVKYRWSIYPTYDFAHCSSDCIEGITHSLCTLEFESNRELYNWLLGILTKVRVIEASVLPKQIEFSRLAVSGFSTSKRGVLRLVKQGSVKSWDDLRLSVIVSFRRLGFTQRSLETFSTTVGITRTQSVLTSGVLYSAIREDLEKHVPRRMTVIRPIKLVLENYWKSNSWTLGALNCSYSHFSGRRKLIAPKEILIEISDLSDSWLCSGSLFQLKYGLLVRCLEIVWKSSGKSVVRGLFVFQVNSWVPNRKVVKVHWVDVGCSNSLSVSLLLLPGKGETSRVVSATEITINEWMTRGSRFQFERRGYFVIDYKTRNGKVSKYNFLTKV